MDPFSVNQMRVLMSTPAQIRNVSVIAHIDHGKSTLTDTLTNAAGFRIKARDHHGDHWPDEVDVGGGSGGSIDRIQSTSNMLRYNFTRLPLLQQQLQLGANVKGTEILHEGDSREFLINLIDFPRGHLDCGFELTAALRITDGALIVVDCIEGVCMSTMVESVLCQALTERIRPALFINKVDRAITELQWDPEETYQCFDKILQSVNVIIATYNDPSMGDLQLSPKKGNVSFGSGLQSWAFSLPRFSALYASKFGVDESKMCERLWGDSFFDGKNKKWIRTEVNQDGERLKRAFCQFCLEPIYQIFDAALTEKRDKMEKMLKSLNIVLSDEERDQKPKQVLQTVMMKLLPAADTLLQMVVLHLPSPKEAQAYRAEMLYAGEPNEAEDKYFRGIKHCDQTAPLMLYISKMVPTSEKGRFVAFGRVFSGTVKVGQKVRIMGNNFVYGKRQDLYESKPVQQTVLMKGRYQEAFEDNIPCGNVCGLVGIDKFIVKSATISDDGESPYPLRDMKYSVSPCVVVAVEPKHVSDLRKLVEGLKQLAMTDPLVVCSMDATGEHTIAGTGEPHLEACLKDLQYTFMNGAPLIVSELRVTYRETVTAESNIQCLSKSANKHNHLYCKSAPLTEELSRDIEDGKAAAAADADPNIRARFLADHYGWAVDGDASKIWSYGPNSRGPNILVDVRKGVVPYMDELKDTFVGAWQIATGGGVLCDENMRGVRMNIEDVALQMGIIRPTAVRGQIFVMARRAFYGSYLTAQPRLMEPVLAVEIQAVGQALEGVYHVIARRRGVVISEVRRSNTSPLFTIQASLPVAESFGFAAAVRARTNTHAFPFQYVFDHWQLVPGDPLIADTLAYTTVNTIRTRKGLKPEIPTLDCFVDKL